LEIEEVEEAKEVKEKTVPIRLCVNDSSFPQLLFPPSPLLPIFGARTR
jgi:hypothetical protein